MTRALRAVGLAGLVMTVMGAAPADDARERADTLVREGAALGERGEWAEAVARFREASALFPRALDHCNLGLAYVRWGRPAEGWLHLTRCEARATEALPRWVAIRREEALAALNAADYTPVEIVAEPRVAEVRVDAFPGEALATPLTVWLPFGAHTFTVSAPSYVSETVAIEVADKAPIRRAVTLTPLPPPEPPPEQIDDNATAHGHTVPTEPLPLRPPPSGPPAGWYVAGGGALVAAVGGVLYGVAIGTRDDAAALPPGDAFVDKRATFRRERDASYVLFGVGGAALAAGLVMLAWPTDDAPAVQVVPVAGGATLGVGLEF